MKAKRLQTVVLLLDGKRNSLLISVDEFDDFERERYKSEKCNDNEENGHVAADRWCQVESTPEAHVDSVQRLNTQISLYFRLVHIRHSLF